MIFSQMSPAIVSTTKPLYIPKHVTETEQAGTEKWQLRRHTLVVLYRNTMNKILYLTCEISKPFIYP